MNRISLLLATCAALAVATSPGADRLSTTTEDFRWASDVSALPEARSAHFRSSFGLRDDVEYIAQSLTDGSAFPDNTFGIPLSVSEAAEMRRRISVQLAAAPAAEWAAGRPDFGGWYIDQSDGGTPVILVAGDPLTLGRGFGEHLTIPIGYRVVSVAHSQVSLLHIADAIWSDRAELTSLGIDVRGVSLDVVNNAVRVEVLNPTSASELELHARYDAIEVASSATAETDACTRLNCPPAKGALQIVDVQHTGLKCTIGFNVKLVAAGDMMILTAGHCLTEGVASITDSWSHNGTLLGHGAESLWGGDYDAGLITQGAVSGDDNLVFWSSAADVPHVVAIASVSAMPVGSPVCRSAYASGYWCGKITLIEQTKDVDNVTVNHMWVEDFDAIPGDSGGPVGLETAPGRLLAFGTHSDSLTNSSPPGGSGWFAPLYYSLIGLNNDGFHVVVCTLAVC